MLASRPAREDFWLTAVVSAVVPGQKVKRKREAVRITPATLLFPRVSKFFFGRP
jgi:hypothetical protein